MSKAAMVASASIDMPRENVEALIHLPTPQRGSAATTFPRPSLLVVIERKVVVRSTGTTGIGIRWVLHLEATSAIKVSETAQAETIEHSSLHFNLEPPN